MATKNTALRNAIAQATADIFEAANATFEVGTSGFAATLATWDFSVTQTATGGVWTFTFDSNTATVGGGGGTAAEARMRDSGTPTYEVTGITVGTSGQNLNFDDVTWTVSQQVTITSFTWTVPAATA